MIIIQYQSTKSKQMRIRLGQTINGDFVVASIGSPYWHLYLSFFAA